MTDLRNKIGSSISRHAKWLLGMLVVCVAVVPSTWLAVLDIKTNERLVREVEHGLSSDARRFARQYAEIATHLLLDENLQAVVDQTGYVVRDPAAPNGAFYASNVPDAETLVEYPFLVDLSDSTVFPGRGARHPDELQRVLGSLTLVDPSDSGRAHGRGYVDGPYGPFHYDYAIDSTSADGGVVMRGVKVDRRSVQHSVLPEAYRLLRSSLLEQTGEDALDSGLYGVEVVTPDTMITFSAVRGGRGRLHRQAVGSYAQVLDFDGLFPGWTVHVYYLNELKAERWRRHLGSLVPLIIVLVGVAYAARLAMRETELNQVKTLFVSNVSHELKTPLTKIQLFNDLLQGMPADRVEKRQRYHNVIHQECDRLTMLIDNVLDLNRIERGEMNYEFSELHVEEVVNEVVETFNVMYEAQNFDLDLEMEAGLPPLMMDPNAIKQALINLTDNAVKYSDTPHTIHMRVRRTKLQGRSAVALSVTDQGVGIPRQNVKVIFEEFYRVDEQKKRAKGSGLGLALVQHIVTAHGGTIDVESRVGVGSTFTITLPLAPSKKRKKR